MNIRRYRTEDKSTLIELWKTIFPNEPPHNEPESVFEAKLKIDDLIFLAEKEGELIGSCMAGYDGHRGWLYSVGVKSEFRRSRIGSVLVKNAVEHLKYLGCIKVNLQIRSTNTQVTKFYKSLGFLEEARLSMGILAK